MNKNIEQPVMPVFTLNLYEPMYELTGRTGWRGKLTNSTGKLLASVVAPSLSVVMAMIEAALKTECPEMDDD